MQQILADAPAIQEKLDYMTLVLVVIRIAKILLPPFAVVIVFNGFESYVSLKLIRYGLIFDPGYASFLNM